MQYLQISEEYNYFDNDSQSFYRKPYQESENQTCISTKQIHSYNKVQYAEEKEPFFQDIKGVKSFQQNTFFEQKKNSIKSIDKKSKIYKPGETKNIPKNVLVGLMKFIETILEKKQIENYYEFVDDLDWKNLKDIPKSQLTKNTLISFLSTKIGRLFGKQYFGQCHWASNFLKQNKTKTSLYYKHNLQYYRMSASQQQEYIEEEEIQDYSQNGFDQFL
ncbi:unnamed protein product [Paramecium sonneborni]|uniref:Uncharacterized protein n=1 Tax=Paramecium sonneborni TaxID=65129 RepID=A0A8S1PTM0_9CILI|nr:unnamed protein product [Paramecium sonneborni]